MSYVRTVVFDKTGTLTKGEFRVSSIEPAGAAQPLIASTSDDPKIMLLEMAAYAEQYSTHPVSEAIREAYGKSIDLSRISHTEEIAGHGVLASVDGHQILAGNAKLMRKYGISFSEEEQGGTVVYVACDGTFAGTIVISDTMKEGVPEAIRDLKAAGVAQTVMLTGDNESAARAIAGQAGVDRVYAQLLPGGKVEIVEKLITEQNGRESLAFVGDGVNDAPVLMRSDVGIAMGLIGSDAAIEAADVVLMDDDVRKISKTVTIARKTMGIIHANIAFAIAVKILILILSVFGIANMWMAIFGDVGVLVLCILNAMRLLTL